MSNDLHDKIMNLPNKRKHLDFDNAHDRVLYSEGHRDARHAAAELSLGYVPALASAAALSGELPPLPAPDTHCYDEDEKRDVWSYSAELVQAYARAAIAHQPPKEALTEKVIAEMWKTSCIEGGDTTQALVIQFARRIEAATAPNAKLVEALKEMIDAYERHIPDHCNANWFDDYNRAIAALAEAGVTGKGE